jgi:hypothetical protein
LGSVPEKFMENAPEYFRKQFFPCHPKFMPKAITFYDKAYPIPIQVVIHKTRTCIKFNPDTVMYHEAPICDRAEDFRNVLLNLRIDIHDICMYVYMNIYADTGKNFLWMQTI